MNINYEKYIFKSFKSLLIFLSTRKMNLKKSSKELGLIVISNIQIRNAGNLSHSGIVHKILYNNTKL